MRSCRSLTRPSYFPPACLALVLIVFLVYSPCLQAGFVNWDDTSHVTENPQVLIHTPETIPEIFLRSVNRTYIPLTVLSFHAEHALAGLDPRIYHWNNIVLHALNSILVFLFALSLGLSAVASWGAALLFAVHPIHVESVAWVTQRKDVLYTFFYLVSMIFYLRFIRGRRGRDYAVSLSMGFLSVLAKPMAISLPWVLLALDVFSGRKIKSKQVWLEKIPFILLIDGIGWITYWQNARVPSLNFPESVYLWVWTAGFPLYKFFFPASLSLLYPSPLESMKSLYALAPLGMVGVVIGGLWVFKRRPLYRFAVIFYALSTFFLWRYDIHDRSLVADRFMYLPSLGWCLFLADGVERTRHVWRSKSRVWLSAILVVVVGLLVAAGLMSRDRCVLWQDGRRLWQEALKRSPRNPDILLGAANSLAKGGEYKQAYALYGTLLLIHPGPAEAWDKRGVIEAEIFRRPKEALRSFEKALTVRPDFAEVWVHKGNVLMGLGRLKEARAAYDQALALDPRRAEAYINRAHYFLQGEGNAAAALRDLNQAIALDASFPEAFINRGLIYAEIQGRWDLALDDFSQAMRLSPQDPTIRERRARVWRRLGREAKARADEAAARRLRQGKKLKMKSIRN